MQTISSRLAQFPAQRIVGTTASLSYREVGEQGDTPVVLLHGIGSGSASWLQQFEQCPAGLRLIAWDAPGYGDSDLLQMHSPLARDYAERLADFIDALQLGPVHLLGHSLGALVATAYASRWPERVRSLILADPASGYGDKDEQSRSVVMSGRIDKLRESGADGIAAHLHERLLSGSASDEAIALVQWGGRRLRAHGYEDAVKMLVAGNLIADANSYEGSALVLCGSRDVVTPPSDARQVAAALSHAGYAEIEGAGHACYVEDPRQFNQLAFGFIQNITKAVPDDAGFCRNNSRKQS